MDDFVTSDRGELLSNKDSTRATPDSTDLYGIEDLILHASSFSGAVFSAKLSGLFTPVGKPEKYGLSKDVLALHVPPFHMYPNPARKTGAAAADIAADIAA